MAAGESCDCACLGICNLKQNRPIYTRNSAFQSALYKYSDTLVHNCQPSLISTSVEIVLTSI